MRLYLPDARAQLPEQHRAHIATDKQKATWGEWHRRYGHLAISGIKQRRSKNMVTGLDVEESSIPSPTCKACIQAKFHVRPFPKEAENRSDVPGDVTHSDIWGPARCNCEGSCRIRFSS
jgi:hypothetical protein